jgi:uncharacterized protein YjiS (DUF1127 family)
MRDYALHRAEAAGEFPGLALAKRLFRNWKTRRRVLALEDYDDHILRDIGVSRLDIRWAAGLPLTTNAALALEERAFRRRKDDRNG